MCGVVGISGTSDVNLRLYDALTMLQHRGQDAAGIVTEANGELHQCKGCLLYTSPSPRDS